MDRIYRMDILINELAYLAVWTEKQYRTKAYPYETQTLSTFYRQKPKNILIKPNQTQHSEEFQKICPFDKNGRMHGLFVRTCLKKKMHIWIPWLFPILPRPIRVIGDSVGTDSNYHSKVPNMFFSPSEVLEIPGAGRDGNAPRTANRRSGEPKPWLLTMKTVNTTSRTIETVVVVVLWNQCVGGVYNVWNQRRWISHLRFV